MPKTPTKSTTSPRRYTLNRRKREFITNSILPLYMERIREGVSSMQKIAESGGTDFITADGARFMAQNLEQQLELAQEIAEDLSGATNDSD